jgi:hypothetical protein
MLRQSSWQQETRPNQPADELNGQNYAGSAGCDWPGHRGLSRRTQHSNRATAQDLVITGRSIARPLAVLSAVLLNIFDILLIQCGQFGAGSPWVPQQFVDLGVDGFSVSVPGPIVKRVMNHVANVAIATHPKVSAEKINQEKYADIARRPTHAELHASWQRA